MVTVKLHLAHDDNTWSFHLVTVFLEEKCSPYVSSYSRAITDEIGFHGVSLFIGIQCVPNKCTFSEIHTNFDEEQTINEKNEINSI